MARWIMLCLFIWAGRRAMRIDNGYAGFHAIETKQRGKKKKDEKQSNS
jgi:hypothetical protein